ncbi:hypothetical protein [Scytonema sp. PRP1]|uniref:hypothetical protein n=1 Tax=Scytonema sp. PRP1 TaxID=3120513 RepID=UPI002FD0ED65
MHSSESDRIGSSLQTAREVLAQAEANKPSFGHSPNGFLSRSHGFLPVTPPLFSLYDFYRHWIRFTYQIVEVENSLNNNFSLRLMSVTRRDRPEMMTKLKAQLLLNSHDTFYKNSLQGILGQKLELLWNITLGFCAADVSITQLPKSIAHVRSSAIASKAEALIAEVNTFLQSLPPTFEDNPEEWARFDHQLQQIEQCDLTLIAHLKLALREGLLAFEQHEDRVVERGGTQLVEALKKIPNIIEHYYTALNNE